MKNVPKEAKGRKSVIEIHRAKDGEWIQPRTHNGHILECCDCGLQHRVNFRIRGTRIQYQAFRVTPLEARLLKIDPQKLKRDLKAGRLHSMSDVFDEIAAGPQINASMGQIIKKPVKGAAIVNQRQKLQPQVRLTAEEWRIVYFWVVPLAADMEVDGPERTRIIRKIGKDGKRAAKLGVSPVEVN